MRNHSIVKNSIYNAVYNLLNIAFPLITIPYLSRILFSEGLGKINYSRNIVGWFLLLATLGIPRYGVREIAKKRENPEKLNSTFSELFLINLGSTVACSVLYIIVLLQIPFFYEQKLLFLVTGIQLFLNIFNVDWFYQGLEEFAYITKRSIFVKAISLISIFLFVRKTDDYVVYAFIQSIAVAGNNILNVLHLRKYASLKLKNLEIRKHIGPIVILLSTSLTVSVYSMLDTTMLGIVCDYSVVGYYSNVQKIISTIAIITASLGNVMLPRLLEYFSEGKTKELCLLAEKALILIISVCLPITIGLFFLAPQLVGVLFGLDFSPAIRTLQIFSPFVIITTIGNLFGTQLLMTFNQEKKLLFTVSVGAVINFSLNSILIRFFQQNGAAIASVVAELVIMILQVVCVNRIVRIKVYNSFLIKTIIINVAISGWLLLIQLIAKTDIVIIVASVVGSICIFFVLGTLTHNSAVIYIGQLVIRKIFKRKKNS